MKLPWQYYVSLSIIALAVVLRNWTIRILFILLAKLVQTKKFWLLDMEKRLHRPLSFIVLLVWTLLAAYISKWTDFQYVTYLIVAVMGIPIMIATYRLRIVTTNVRIYVYC